MRLAGFSARADMIARHFKFFLVAAEEQSFQRAAERLHVAQSALSRRISDMEREMGDVALFERFARGVRLTEAGQSMLEDVRRITNQIEEASRKAWRIDRGEVGLLRIGFADTTGWRRVIPDTLKQFEAGYPEVEVQLTPMVSEVQRTNLRSGAIDLGLMFDDLALHHDADGELVSVPLSLHRFVLVVPEGHRLHDAERITLSDLRDENLIWPSRRHAPALFSRLLEACREPGFTPRIKIEVIAIDMAYKLTSTGLGLAMILAEDDAEPPPGLKLRRIEDFRLDMQYLMMWRRDNNAPALVNFVEMATKLLGVTPPRNER
jgi:DNA-binding transcriptional LysR family regulator